ncbi:pilus assembly protein CpaF [Agromyces sp. Root1464]|uniref:CpaF family protein n=1 Tax=Agromyces sp. Root1464 TaxID=1736467 RepID=UPI0006FE6502|nr:CpaF family protein [Agromyces sp. Root1464]KQZ11089.1 pilus assembly protein CpaF [Agromyces sp. Root1464]
MNLNDRLNALRNAEERAPSDTERPAAYPGPPNEAVAVPEQPQVVAASVEPLAHSDPRGANAFVSPQPVSAQLRRPAPAVDPLAEMKEKAAQELFGRIGSRLNDSSLTEEQLHQLARHELSEIVAAEQLALTTAERNRLIDDIGADVLGYGPLEPLLDDESVSEIMVNRHDQIYVERYGRLQETPYRFTGEPQLRRVIERIVSRVGRRIDEASPLVDARLEDGSRVNAIIPPLAVDGSSLTIRKFAGTPYTVDDLIRFGTLTREAATVLDAAVRAKLNILVSGGTGTGKTTLLNVLSAFIPGDERIVTIEDAVELQLQQEHVVRLESRPPNIEGRGEITIRDLVRNSLRMRPDRIVVGEVRGAESLDMLQAMNTGHEGSISTLHANAPRDAIARMETLVLMAGMELPLRAIREQIASAIDIIVQISRHKDGVRRVTAITEVHGMEGDVITLQDAFSFDYSAGYDDEGRLKGTIEPTGVRPRFAERIADQGIALPIALFQVQHREMLGEIR